MSFIHRNKMSVHLLLGRTTYLSRFSWKNVRQYFNFNLFYKSCFYYWCGNKFKNVKNKCLTLKDKIKIIPQVDKNIDWKANIILNIRLPKSTLKIEYDIIVDYFLSMACKVLNSFYIQFLWFWGKEHAPYLFFLQRPYVNGY